MLGELFDEQIEAVREAVDRRRNVVVASEPFGGHNAVVEEAVSDLDAESVSFSSVNGTGDIEVPDDGVCVVDGLGYLYTRRIGGFAPLERFVGSVAASDAVVVSSWNIYSWGYVRHAVDTSVLGKTVEVPNLDAAETARYLASEHDVSEYADALEEATSDGTAAVRYRLPFGVGRLLEEGSDNVFEEISAASNGNPGVASAVFESRSWDTEHDDPDLSYDDAFALRVVLSKETVERDVLTSVVEPMSLETTLRKLADSGFVETDGGTVSLRPERLVDAVDLLERRRLVW